MPTPYHQLISNANVPQSQQVDPRQIKNAGGGYAFQVTDKEQLDRFLILGSTGGTYYIGERKLTKMNIDAIKRLINSELEYVVNRVLEVSQRNLAPSNDPAIFVLAYICATVPSPARLVAWGVLKDVCRIPTHLFTFMTYYNGLGGKSSSSARGAIGRWYTSQSDHSLALNLTKYQQRDGMSNIDLINFSHPKPITDAQKWLFTGEINPVNQNASVPESIAQYMNAIQIVKSPGTLEAKVNAIHSARLPREVLPTELLNKPEVWDALLVGMPPHALIRNLGKMTSVGLLTPMSDATVTVLGKLADVEQLRKSRVHPMMVYMALMTYQRGQGVKGSLSWKPVDKIIQALNEAVYKTFQLVKPTNRKMLVAVDYSLSMANESLTGISCAEVGAAMATVIGNTEPLSTVVKFDTSWKPLQVLGRRIDDVSQEISNWGQGTDVAQAIYAAGSIVEPLDQIVIFTDNETWAGRQHVHVAYEQYKRSRNSNVSLVIISAEANQVTVGDPSDSSVLNVVGFDTSVPAVIAAWPKAEQA